MVALVLTGVVGFFAGGTWAALVRVPWQQSSWLVAALGAQALGSLLAEVSGASAPYLVGLVVSLATVAAFLAANRSLAGVPLVTAGLLLNVTVVAANGAMPVSTHAAARAGVHTHDIADGSDPRHRLAGAGTRLRLLGDVVPAPWPVRPEVLSVGDLLTVAGLAELALTASRRRRRSVGATDDHMRGADRGEEEAQAPGAGEEQGQPRQAAERLTSAV
jgi:hypothetical protein